MGRMLAMRPVNVYPSKASFKCELQPVRSRPTLISMAETKNLYENRMCNQWDNWRAYGPELLL